MVSKKKIEEATTTTTTTEKPKRVSKKKIEETTTTTTTEKPKRKRSTKAEKAEIKESKSRAPEQIINEKINDLVNWFNEVANYHINRQGAH